MTKINILDKSVYNQISAGEVVENPASIVKELIENSIDAGAQNITVMIEDGGIKSIQIIDDGDGMDENDLYNSILPHATSKIIIAEDLATISTLGFRGEALASITAVSEVEIKSKFYDSALAYGITVKGGETIEKGVVPLSKGTSITITNLFYNTPARYKFLKTKKGEQNLISELIQNMIVANESIAFRYYIDKKLIYSSAGKDLRSALESIYSREILDNLLELNYEEKPYRIYGFIAKPSSPGIKFNRSYQTIIINGRVIKDFSLSSVVHNAYAEKLMRRTFPVFVLDIIMPFDLVDANVHPNKKEVRFAADCKINGIIYKAIKRTLEQSNDIACNEMSFLKNEIPNANKNAEIVSNSVVLDKLKNNDIAFNEMISQKNIYNDGIVANVNMQSKDIENTDEINKKLSYLSSTSPKHFDGVYKVSENTSFSQTIEAHKEETSYKLIGQAFDTYIILEYNKDLYFIDQHAAHERIIYDDYLKIMTKKPIDIQDLMIPYLYEADENYEIILRNEKMFEDMGFIIEDFGNNIIKVSGVPLIFSDIDIDAFLSDTVSSLIDLKNVEDITLLKDKIAKKACKSAIKGGVTLDNDDIKYVMEMLSTNDIPLQCPHGRPVIIKLSQKDLEKMFRRIV